MPIPIMRQQAITVHRENAQRVGERKSVAAVHADGIAAAQPGIERIDIGHIRTFPVGRFPLAREDWLSRPISFKGFDKPRKSDKPPRGRRTLHLLILGERRLMVLRAPSQINAFLQSLLQLFLIAAGEVVGLAIDLRERANGEKPWP
jgi:hypothetical protein